MPDQTPVPPAPQSAAPPSAPASVTTGPTINIAAEFGTAKRNLPPVKALLLALAGVLVIVGAVSFLQRARPQAAGTIVNVTAAQIPKQNAVLVAFTFSLRNPSEKSLWVKSIQGKMVSSEGELTGDAVSAVDFDRYYQGFPELKRNTEIALAPEDKLQPGQEVKRTVIVSFPVTLEKFNQRKSVSVILQPYDQPLPVVLTEFGAVPRGSIHADAPSKAFIACLTLWASR